MSGPIVRKYGFPNFDEIFGKKELEHGVDEAPAGKDGPSNEGKPEAKEGRPQEKPKGA